MSAHDTDQLMTLARNGDARAQQELLMHYRDRLRRMISAFLDPRLAPRLDPSDVLQEALTCAAVRLPKYLQEPPIGFYPWLRQIVREQLVVVHRRHVLANCRSVHKEQPLQPGSTNESAMLLANRLISQDTSPSQRAIHGEMRVKVRNAISDLGESDRELIIMRFVEQLKIEEISDAIGISQSAVKSRVARILQKLSKLVKSVE